MRVALSHYRTTLVWRKIIAQLSHIIAHYRTLSHHYRTLSHYYRTFSHGSPWSSTWKIHFPQRFFYVFGSFLTVRETPEKKICNFQQNTTPIYPQQHSTQYTVHSTQYTVHSTQYTVHSTQYTVHSTQYTVHSTQRLEGLGCWGIRENGVTSSILRQKLPLDTTCPQKRNTGQAFPCTKILYVCDNDYRMR